MLKYFEIVLKVNLYGQVSEDFYHQQKNDRFNGINMKRVLF